MHVRGDTSSILTGQSFQGHSQMTNKNAMSMKGQLTVRFTMCWFYKEANLVLVLSLSIKNYEDLKIFST